MSSYEFPKPLDYELNCAESGYAIVCDGDTAPKAISSGQYLFIKNHSTLATGGYHATAAIASGADLTSSNTAPDADGIANAINSNIGTVPSGKTLQGQIETVDGKLTLNSVSDLKFIAGDGASRYFEMSFKIGNDAYRFIYEYDGIFVYKNGSNVARY